MVLTRSRSKRERAALVVDKKKTTVESLRLEEEMMSAIVRLSLNQLVIRKATEILAMAEGRHLCEAGEADETEYEILLGLFSKIVGLKKGQSEEELQQQHHVAVIVLSSEELCFKMMNKAVALSGHGRNNLVKMVNLGAGNEVTCSPDIVITTLPLLMVYLKSHSPQVHFLALNQLDFKLLMNDLKSISSLLPNNVSCQTVICSSKSNESARDCFRYFTQDTGNELEFHVHFKEELVVMDELNEKCNEAAVPDEAMPLAESKISKYETTKDETLEKSFKTSEAKMCPHCNKMISSYFDRHLKMHMGQRPHKCKQCELAFKYKSHLTRHKMIHENEHPFKCSKCPKVFSRPDYLRSHEISHGEEKPFKCKKCKLAYKHKKSLNVHLASHKNARLYKCDLCDKSYNRSDHLKTHRVTHDKENQD